MPRHTPPSGALASHSAVCAAATFSVCRFLHVPTSLFANSSFLALSFVLPATGSFLALPVFFAGGGATFRFSLSGPVPCFFPAPFFPALRRAHGNFPLSADGGPADFEGVASPGSGPSVFSSEGVSVAAVVEGLSPSVVERSWLGRES